MSDTRLRVLDTSALSYIERGQEPWVSRRTGLLRKPRCNHFRQINVLLPFI